MEREFESLSKEEQTKFEDIASGLNEKLSEYGRMKLIVTDFFLNMKECYICKTKIDKMFTYNKEKKGIEIGGKLAFHLFSVHGIPLESLSEMFEERISSIATKKLKQYHKAIGRDED